MNKYKAIKVNGSKIDEHRFIMQQKLGRKLSFNEVVHHKDGDKSNNSLDNLEVLSRSKHSSMHQKGKKPKPETIAKLREIHRQKRTMAKLTEENVIEIRRFIDDGVRIVEIADKFNVSRHAIYKIKNKVCFGYI